MRGYQYTDVNGEVEFLTVFPGWYNGRVCHIHFQVFVSSAYSVVSQLGFNEAAKKMQFTLLIQHFIQMVQIQKQWQVMVFFQMGIHYK